MTSQIVSVTLLPLSNHRQQIKSFASNCWLDSILVFLNLEAQINKYFSSNASWCTSEERFDLQLFKLLCFWSHLLYDVFAVQKLEMLRQHRSQQHQFIQHPAGAFEQKPASHSPWIWFLEERDGFKMQEKPGKDGDFGRYIDEGILCHQGNVVLHSVT